MKLKYTFAVNEVAGQLVAVPIDCEYGEQSIIKTNETGAYILNLLKTNISVQDILANIKENFEVVKNKGVKVIFSGVKDKLSDKVINIKKPEILHALKHIYHLCSILKKQHLLL